LLKTWSDIEPINIGTGTDVTIAELARLIADIVGFKGRFVFDSSKPRNPSKAPRYLQTDHPRLAAAHRPRGRDTPNLSVVPNLPCCKALTATPRRSGADRFPSRDKGRGGNLPEITEPSRRGLEMLVIISWSSRASGCARPQSHKFARVHSGRSNPAAAWGARGPREYRLG
jgi:hypothetical protein